MYEIQLIHTIDKHYFFTLDKDYEMTIAGVTTYFKMKTFMNFQFKCLSNLVLKANWGHLNKTELDKLIEAVNENCTQSLYIALSNILAPDILETSTL